MVLSTFYGHFSYYFALRKLLKMDRGLAILPEMHEKQFTQLGKLAPKVFNIKIMSVKFSCPLRMHVFLISDIYLHQIIIYTHKKNKEKEQKKKRKGEPMMKLYSISLKSLMLPASYKCC